MLDPILNLFFSKYVQHISLTYFGFYCCVLNSATCGSDWSLSSPGCLLGRPSHQDHWEVGRQLSKEVAWVGPWRKSGISLAALKLHALVPTRGAVITLRDLPRRKATSPVAGQISQQFCVIDSTPRQQRTPRQLANIFFPPATVEPPASRWRPDLDMALDIFWCYNLTPNPRLHHKERQQL